MTRLADDPRVEANVVAEPEPDPVHPAEPASPDVEPEIDAEADDHADATPPGTDLPADRSVAAVPAGARSRWAIVGGLVSLLYVVWYVVDLVVLDTNPSGFTAAHRVYGNVAFRGLFALVFLAIVFHGIDGLRSTVTDAFPRLRRHDVGLRASVRFLTFAVWIPATVILVWPAIREWFSR